MSSIEPQWSRVRKLSSHADTAMQGIKSTIVRHLVVADIVFLSCSILFMIIGIGVHYKTLHDAPVASPLQRQASVLQTAGLTQGQKSLYGRKKEVIAFIPSWTVAQKSPIQRDSATQLIYFGLGVTEQGKLIKYDEAQAPVLEWQYFTSDTFQETLRAARASNVRVGIAIKNFDNTSIDTLISNEQATQTFINDVSLLLTTYQLDSLNLDFEYITDSSFPTSRYLNRFLESVVTALKKQNPRFFVSIDVNATSVMLDPAYDMSKIGGLVDGVVVMAYDYAQAASTRASEIAPLFADENAWSVDRSITSLKGRVASEKIILGVPFYGYEWETLNQQYHSQTIPNSGALATYKRVKELLAHRDDAQMHWNTTTKSPWLSYVQSGAIKQIYYENQESLQAKIDYVQQEDLGGVAIWASGYEGESLDLWEPIKSLASKE